MTALLSDAQIAACMSAGDFEIAGECYAPALYSARSWSAFSARSTDGDLRLRMDASGVLSLYARGVLIGSTTAVASFPGSPTYQNWIAGDWLEYRAWHKPVAAGARGWGVRLSCNGCFGQDTVGTPAGGGLATPTAIQARSSWDPNALRLVHGASPTAIGGPASANQIPRGVILSDSIMAPFSAYKPAGTYIYTPAEAKVNGYGILSLATVSDSSAQQLAKWQASNARGAGAVAWVAIQLGYNDIDDGLSDAHVVVALQAVVDDVAAQNPSAKIVLMQMTPAKAAMDAGMPAGAYDKWVAINAAIANGGVTGTHAIVTSHQTTLNDGAGNLAGAYNSGDHVHPNNAGRAVVASALRTALNFLGVS